MKIKRKAALVLTALYLLAATTYASETNGSINASNNYAWGENVGWINFNVSQGNVAITDSALTGYAWGENIGWISLNCSNDSSCSTASYGVSNNGEGVLSGYAWGENVGWINFAPTGSGVSINSSGEFTGYAWGENVGWLSFNCSNDSSCSTADYKVATDWRPQSSRSGSSQESQVTTSGSLIPNSNHTRTNSAPVIPSTNQDAKKLTDLSVRTQKQIKELTTLIQPDYNAFLSIEEGTNIAIETEKILKTIQLSFQKVDTRELPLIPAGKPASYVFGLSTDSSTRIKLDKKAVIGLPLKNESTSSDSEFFAYYYDDATEEWTMVSECTKVLNDGVQFCEFSVDSF